MGSKESEQRQEGQSNNCEMAPCNVRKKLHAPAFDPVAANTPEQDIAFGLKMNNFPRAETDRRLDKLESGRAKLVSWEELKAHLVG